MIEKDRLEHMYWIENMTQSEIAEKENVTQVTVSNWMEQYEIETRDNSLEPPIERVELHDMYWDESLSMSDIADKFYVCRETVSKWLDELDIEKRNSHEAGVLANGRTHPNFKIDSHGYPVCISNNSKTGNCDRIAIHQLVTIADGESPYDIFGSGYGKCVHHINGCKIDNRPENLETMEWSSHVEKHHQQGDLDISGIIQ
jgi:predicted DNA-binding protein YlxM (UPF0122 family)